MRQKSLIAFAVFVGMLTSCQKFGLPGEGGGYNQTYTVLSVKPLEGEPGTHVFFKGKGFSNDSTRNTILVNGRLAKIVRSSDTTVEAIIPETDASTAQLRIVVNKVPSRTAFTFRYDDVYVAGAVYDSTGTTSFARLWKNGVAVPIFNNSKKFTSATAVAIHAGNVYVSTNGGYFKNLSFVLLDSALLPFDIKIHNGSVYVTQTEGYYKDGVPTIFPHVGSFGSNYIHRILFQGNDMYVVGGDYYGQGAVLYKNNVMIPQQGVNIHCGAYAVAIHGTDTHVVGFSDFQQPSTDWINGVPTFPGFGYGLTDILFIENTKYLVTGQPYNMYVYQKDSTSIPTFMNTYFQGTALASHAGNIYAAGTNGTHPNGIGNDAAYYRNTTLVTLEKNGIANGITVVARH